MTTKEDMLDETTREQAGIGRQLSGWQYRMMSVIAIFFICICYICKQLYEYSRDLSKYFILTITPYSRILALSCDEKKVQRSDSHL